MLFTFAVLVNLVCWAIFVGVCSYLFVVGLVVP